MIVTIKHLEIAKAQGHPMCVRGLRAWADRHGLSFQDLMRNGLPIEELEATDELGRMIARIARDEEEAKDGR